jgi:hypothetical protein
VIRADKIGVGPDRRIELVVVFLARHWSQ